MRVVCSDVPEFLENLRALDPESVFEGAIRVSVLHRPIDGNRFTASRFDVVFQASAVVRSDHGEYLLALGEDCGSDYHTGDASTEGSDRAAEARRWIEDICAEKAWTILPGHIEI